VTAAKATSDAKGDGTDGKRVSIREALLPGADSDIPVVKSAVIDDDDVGDSDVVVGGVPCSPFYIYIFGVQWWTCTLFLPLAHGAASTADSKIPLVPQFTQPPEDALIKGWEWKDLADFADVRNWSKRGWSAQLG
jgi:hypothetical protein